MITCSGDPIPDMAQFVWLFANVDANDTKPAFASAEELRRLTVSFWFTSPDAVEPHCGA